MSNIFELPITDRNYIPIYKAMARLDHARNDIEPFEFEGFDAFVIMKQPYQWEVSLRSGHIVSDAFMIDCKECMPSTTLEDQERLTAFRNAIFADEQSAWWHLFFRMGGNINDGTFRGRLFMQNKERRHVRVNISSRDKIIPELMAKAHFWAAKNNLIIGECLASKKTFVPGSVLK